MMMMVIKTPEQPKVLKRTTATGNEPEDIGDAKASDFFQTSGRLTAQFVDDVKKETGEQLSFAITKITKEHRMINDPDTPLVPVLHFEEIEFGTQTMSSLALNSTNNKILVESLGDVYKNWIGAKVTLGTMPTKKPDGTATKGIIVTNVVPASK
jgi:hypothetical protein